MTKMGWVLMHPTSKRVELDSPGYSGFEKKLKVSNPEQPGLSKSIRLEVMCIQTQLLIPVW